MDIKLREVEWFGLVSMWIGIGLFVVICLWDILVGVQMHHNSGYGWMQILGMAGSGLYSMWAWAINSKWRDYQRMIHGFNLED